MNCKEEIYGNGTVNLMATEIGPGILLNEANKKTRVMVGVSGDGPHIGLMDENRKGRAIFDVTSLETTRSGAVTKLPPSSLVLFDKDGKVVFKAPLID